MYKLFWMVLILLCPTFAQIPAYKDAGTIKAGGSAISILVPAPCACDWNGDGKTDLIAGQFTDGKINLYINNGTNSSPQLAASKFLQADGQDISLSYG